MKNNLINPKFSISSKLGIYSKSYNDIYFDKLNGLKEKEHVYLNTNYLQLRRICQHWTFLNKTL